MDIEEIHHRRATSLLYVIERGLRGYGHQGRIASELKMDEKELNRWVKDFYNQLSDILYCRVENHKTMQELLDEIQILKSIIAGKEIEIRDLKKHMELDLDSAKSVEYRELLHNPKKDEGAKSEQENEDKKKNVFEFTFEELEAFRGNR